MSKEELLELKYAKEKELAKIEKQLDEIFEKEFKEVEDYMGKYYRLNNSNCYFHVTGYNHDTKDLVGYEICFLVDSLDLYEAEYNIVENEKYEEISKEELENSIRIHIDMLVKQFME